MSMPPPPHVVILEEARELAAAFAARLAREGFRVTALTDFVIDPAELLEMLPDLVVLDIRCGYRLEGIDFLRRLRADPAGSEVEVLASPTITPIDVERYGPELRVLGAVVLPDPFDVDDLLVAAWAAVARARSARQRSDAARAVLRRIWAKQPEF